MSLIAWYKLDGNANDSTSTALNGTATSVTYSTGKIGTAAVFDGVNSYIKLPDTPSIVTPIFTMAAWVKAKGLGAGMEYCGIVGTSYGSTMYIAATGNLCVRIRDNVAIQKYVVPDINLFDDKWHHIAYSYDGINIRAYIDGIMKFEFASEYKMGGQTAYIGAESNNYQTRRFWGSIDDVRIYSHALSDKEIKELIKAKILHYTFDDFQEPTTNLIGSTKVTFVGWAAYNAASITLTQNQTVPEWNTTTATRIQSSGGTSTIKYYTTVESNSVVGKPYALSGYFKNLGTTNVNITNNLGQSATIAPGESKFISFVGYGNGSTNSQYRIHTNAISDILDIIAFRPQVEEKDHYTAYTSSSRSNVVTDYSDYGNSGALVNATTPKWINDSKIGSGAYEFNTAQYIQPTNTAIMDYLIKGVFTISFWMNPQQTVNEMEDIFGGGSWGNTTGGVAFGRWNPTNQWCLDVYGLTSGRKNIIFAGDIIPFNQWSHVCIKVDRDNLWFGVYVNGMLVNSGIYFNDDLNWNKTTYPFRIGKGYLNASYFGLLGKLDDFRIYVTALSDEDIKELYYTKMSLDDKGNLYANFVSNGLVAWYPLKGDTLDYSGNNNNLETYGDPVLADGLNGLNYSLDGIDDYFVNNNVPALLANSDFTVSYWLKYSHDLPQHTIAFNTSTGGNNILINIKNTVHSVYFNSIDHMGTISINDGLWHMATVIWNCRTGLMTQYIDTVKDVEYSIKDAILSTNRFSIGQEWDTNTPTQFFNGMLADIRLYDRVISDNEIIDLYVNPYKSFGLDDKGILNTGDVNSFGSCNGLVAHYTFDGNAKDRIGTNHGTVSGAILTNGIEGSAYEFDGVDDYIMIACPFTQTYNLFTISGFIYPRNVTDGLIITPTSAGSDHRIFYDASNQRLGVALCSAVDTNTRGRYSMDNSVPLNQWTHFVAIIDKLNISIYINGVFDSTYTETLPIALWSGDWYIGKRGTLNTLYLNGKLDDIQIYNRVLTAEEIKMIYDFKITKDTMKLKNNAIYLRGELKNI